jgi:hypothetical protein
MQFEIFASAEIKPDFVSNKIMENLGIDFSHVGIIVNNAMIYDATGRGIDKEGILEFTKERKFIHRYDVTPYLKCVCLLRVWL